MSQAFVATSSSHIDSTATASSPYMDSTIYVYTRRGFAEAKGSAKAHIKKSLSPRALHLPKTLALPRLLPPAEPKLALSFTAPFRGWHMVGLSASQSHYLRFTCFA